MKRLLLFLSICLCTVSVVPHAGDAKMMKSTLVVATDTPPRMMDPL
jgi:hypothetical protein